jgi:hypothetical protein
MFAADALDAETDVDVICADRDLRGILLDFQVKLMRAARGRATAGILEWSNMGWYQLAATAAVRQRCCAKEASSIKLPAQLLGDCKQLSQAVTEVIAPPITSTEVADRTKRFHDDLLCLYARGVPRPYPFKKQPTTFNRHTFVGFAKRVAEFDAGKTSR